jgi:hypothetical protein
MFVIVYYAKSPSFVVYNVIWLYFTGEGDETTTDERTQRSGKNEVFITRCTRQRTSLTCHVLRYGITSFLLGVGLTSA